MLGKWRIDDSYHKQLLRSPKIMKPNVYTFLLFTILIVTSFFGCSREEEILLSIANVEIYTTAIYGSDIVAVIPNELDIVAVSVLVTGRFSDDCLTLQKTRYTIAPRVADRYPIYLDGDAIVIEIPLLREQVFLGDVECDLASPYYIDVIFLGYCEPGEYTLDVNGYVETFKVD